MFIHIFIKDRGRILSLFSILFFLDYSDLVLGYLKKKFNLLTLALLYLLYVQLHVNFGISLPLTVVVVIGTFDLEVHRKEVLDIGLERPVRDDCFTL